MMLAAVRVVAAPMIVALTWVEPRTFGTRRAFLSPDGALVPAPRRGR